MLMLVRLGDRRTRGNRWLGDLDLVAITLGPYAILLWLFWPRH